jgi:serine/threonine-protein kinase
LALFGRIGFLLSIVFSALLAILVPDLLISRGVAAVSRHVIDLAFLATWLICRRGRVRLSMLRVIDAGFPIAACLTTALPSIVWPGRMPGQEWQTILVMANILFTRAVFIPSPPRRTLLIGVAAALPVGTASLIFDRSAAATTGMPILSINALLWSLCAIAITTLGSAVIYGLQEKIRAVQQLGQYTLGAKLGEGGMGIVYRAHHALLRRPTAVKLLPPQKAGEHAIRRFEREVQLTAQLSHPNTVAIYDYGRTPDGIFYYAMEYLDGTNLQTLVKEFGPQPPARVVHILRQVAGALREAHESGLVHRDVKPANIILCQRGGLYDVAKVVDFGLVRDLGGNRRTSMSDLNLVAGTPLYLAPEAITHPDEVDARSDLYALGAVGYFLLTGVNVFEGATLIEVCSHHLHTLPVPPSQRVSQTFPPTLEALIMGCLEKDKTRRPPTAKAFAERLAETEGAGEWSERDAEESWRAQGERLAAARAAAGAAGDSLTSLDLVAVTGTVGA